MNQAAGHVWDPGGAGERAALWDCSALGGRGGVVQKGEVAGDCLVEGAGGSWAGRPRWDQRGRSAVPKVVLWGEEGAGRMLGLSEAGH